MATRETPIDAYLAQVSEPRRTALEKLRATIRTIIPLAEECLSYKIHAFRVDGKIIAGFAATAKGCSYFPFSGSTLKTLASHLHAHGGTKSALHFDPAKGLAPSLVRRLIRARLPEGRKSSAPARPRRSGSGSR